MNRTITHRNILGGFFGGLCGILACGYLHFLLIPVGMILGLLGGFYYQEITETAVATYKRQKRLARVRLYLYTRKPRMLMRNWRNYTKNIGLEKLFIWPVSLVMGFVTHIILLSSFRAWFRRHPMNRAYLLRAFTVAMYFVVNSVFVWFVVWPFILQPLGQFIEAHANDRLGLVGLVFIIILYLVFLAILMSPLVFARSGKKLAAIRQYDQEFERFNKSKVSFFIHDIKVVFMAEGFTIAFIVGTVIYGIFASILYVAFALVPVLTLFGVIKGLYKVSKRTDHWLCLVVTAGVTLTSAYLAYPYLGSTTTLWFVAFVTGIVSGLLAEGIRQALAYVFRLSQKLKHAAVNPIGIRLTWANTLFVSGHNTIFGRLDPLWQT